ncbi:MAG: ParB/RepB/Spo0J family partition protein [Mariprofundales bacterium]|nr:ParB/RepB/Spo0J family partition protein [Mariprofundales bacterium]
MEKKKNTARGLGRGLNALFMDDEPETNVTISVEIIHPNPYQPRRAFIQRELEALTESIRRNGVLTPVLLRARQDETYELIAGERRWRAAKLAGLATIPAVVREVSDVEALSFAIVENEQRDDLSAIESAYAYQRLIDEFGFSQQQVAESVGASRSQVSNLLRLQQLPDTIRLRIEQRELTMGQTRPLIGLPGDTAERIAVQCVKEGWSARRMEREAKKAARQKNAPTITGSSQPLTDQASVLQEEIGRHIGIAVDVRCDNQGGGKITIPFAHAGELELLLSRLRQREHLA